MSTRKSIKLGAFTLLAVLIAALLSCSNSEKTDNQTARDSMIIDTLDNAEKYFDMHPNFQKAFEFLRQENLAEMAPGRYELLGDSLFCMIAKDTARTRDAAVLEAHKKYIDIQYVIAGEETFGWKPFGECSEIDKPYDDGKDIMFFKDEPKTWTTASAGSFVIFFPAEDAHAPLVGKGVIHKVVCKVLK